jgi:hypothetical protein
MSTELAERDSSCDGCPFKSGIPIAYFEKGDSPQPPMMCHESESLEGLLPDTKCYSWNKYCYGPDGMMI